MDADKLQRINSVKTVGVYALYIVMACSITMALNVIHTKYILGLELQANFFIVPIVAGILFGYVAAYVRSPLLTQYDEGNIRIYLKYIGASCMVTFALNVVHTEWVLGLPLEGTLFAAPAIAGVFFGYLLAKIKVLNNKLYQLASTDILTKAYNRLHIEQMLNAEIDRCNRYGGHFSVIYFDVDFFKEINDQFGHQTGDHVLAVISKAVRDNNRSSDTFARYGGDEFLILATGTRHAGALQHAKRIKKSIENLNIQKVGKVSCTFGIAEFINGKDDLQSVITACDEALYKAKEKGRNCIVVAERDESRLERDTSLVRVLD